MASSPRRSLVSGSLVSVLPTLPLVLSAMAASAAVMGAAPARPYPEAVAASRAAAQAVLAREGRESCLIGKLTNALLGLASSCEASGERGRLCALADRAAATTRWSMEFTDATARGVLELTGTPAASAAASTASELQTAAP